MPHAPDSPRYLRKQPAVERIEFQNSCRGALELSSKPTLRSFFVGDIASIEILRETCDYGSVPFHCGINRQIFFNKL